MECKANSSQRIRTGHYINEKQIKIVAKENQNRK
jgi:hypothetical protein